MSAMWKWVMLAALLYGMLAVAVALSPRTAALGQFLDLAAVSDGWEVPKHIPRSYDFESPSTPPITRPPANVEVIALPDDNHILRWNPPDDTPMAILGLPLASPVEGATLELKLRASHLPAGTLLIVGVHERDGSLYAAPQLPSPEWQQLRIPWTAFKLARSSNDQNTVLDAAEIDGIFIALRAPILPRDAHPQQGVLPSPNQRYDQRRRPQRDQLPEHQQPPASHSEPPVDQSIVDRTSVSIEIDDVAFSSPVVP